MFAEQMLKEEVIKIGGTPEQWEKLNASITAISRKYTRNKDGLCMIVFDCARNRHPKEIAIQQLKVACGVY